MKTHFMILEVVAEDHVPETDVLKEAEKLLKDSLIFKGGNIRLADKMNMLDA